MKNIGVLRDTARAPKPISQKHAIPCNGVIRYHKIPYHTWPGELRWPEMRQWPGELQGALIKAAPEKKVFGHFLLLDCSIWTETMLYDQGISLRRSGYPTCLYSEKNYGETAVCPLGREGNKWPLLSRHPVPLPVIVAFPVIVALPVMYGMVSYDISWLHCMVLHAFTMLASARGLCLARRLYTSSYDCSQTKISTLY